jgi:hypothetical protein
MDHPADRPPKRCDECTEPATWVRRTQFAGTHYFCTTHAHREEDFGHEDPSYFFWEALPPTPDDERLEGYVPIERSTARHPNLCEVCDQPPTWVRRTQFSGNHFFCTTHAQQEEDFGQGDDSYFFWEDLPFALFCEEEVDVD